MTDGTTHNGAPVYAQQDGDHQMWYEGDWAVGTDYNADSYGILSKVMLENGPQGSSGRVRASPLLSKGKL